MMYLSSTHIKADKIYPAILNACFKNVYSKQDNIVNRLDECVSG